MSVESVSRARRRRRRCEGVRPVYNNIIIVSWWLLLLFRRGRAASVAGARESERARRVVRGLCTHARAAAWDYHDGGGDGRDSVIESLRAAAAAAMAGHEEGNARRKNKTPNIIRRPRRPPLTCYTRA